MPFPSPGRLIQPEPSPTAPARPLSARPRCSAGGFGAYLASFAFSTLFVCSTRADAEELGLAEAIRLAQANNERTRLAELKVEGAEGDVTTAQSNFLPDLTLRAATTVTPYEDRNGRFLTGGGTLTLRQPLLDPSGIPTYARAKHNLEAEKLSASEERRAVAFDTARVYVRALAADRVVAAAKVRLDTATKNLAEVNARVEAELTSTNDATRGRLDMTSAARDVARAERDYDIALLDLGLLIGKTTQGVTITPWTFQEAETAPKDAAMISERALARRTDLKALDERRQAAEAAEDEPLYRLAPSIDLTAEFGVNPDPIAPQRWDEEALTLSLTWVLFDGGARYGDRRARRADASAIEVERTQLERTIHRDVASALRGIQAARTGVTIAEEAVKIARKNSEETMILYQQDLARAIELTDANAARFEAEVDLASAKLDLGLASLELCFAQGLEPMCSTSTGDRR